MCAALGDLYLNGDGVFLPRRRHLIGLKPLEFQNQDCEWPSSSGCCFTATSSLRLQLSGHTNARRYFDRLHTVRSTVDAVTIVMELQSEDLGIDYDLQFAEAICCVDGRVRL